MYTDNLFFNYRIGMFANPLLLSKGNELTWHMWIAGRFFKTLSYFHSTHGSGIYELKHHDCIFKQIWLCPHIFCVSNIRPSLTLRSSARPDSTSDLYSSGGYATIMGIHRSWLPILLVFCGRYRFAASLLGSYHRVMPQGTKTLWTVRPNWSRRIEPATDWLRGVASEPEV